MSVLAFDTETWLIAPGRLAPRLVCLSWSDGRTAAVLSADEGARWFRARLEAGDTLIGHNVAFDVAVLLQHDPSLRELIWLHYDQGLFSDTSIRDRLNHIARGWYKQDRSGKRPQFSLSALSARYLGKALDGKSDADAWRYRYRELDGVPIGEWPSEALTYALEDARTTARVWEAMPEASPDLERQVRSAWSLHLVSAWGLRTDPKAVAALRSQLDARSSELRATLVEAGLLRSTGAKNMAAIRERVVTALGSKAPKTNAGAVSTARAVLDSTGDPQLVKVGELTAVDKLRGTYLPVLERATTQPVNPQYWLVESGRTSCSRPNVQNQPRGAGVRECWVPRDGYTYVGCDYHGAELCTLAQVCTDWFGSSAMADAINAGQDLHLVTAASILGITYDDAVERRAAGDKAIKQARQQAKAANFGFPGGLGVAAFREYASASYGVEVTEAEAKRLKRTWLDSYPEMQKYFDRISTQCGPVGQFEATQVRSNRVRGQCGYCDGANTYFQGLAADGARDAVYRVVRATHTPDDALYGCHVVAFIHDEVIIEAPSERIHEAGERLSELMIEAMAEWCPDVTIRAEAHAMERWYKDAEPVHQAGRLVPWRPREA